MFQCPLFVLEKALWLLKFKWNCNFCNIEYMYISFRCELFHWKSTSQVFFDDFKVSVVRLGEVSIKEFSYSKLEEKWHGPEPSARLIELIVCRTTLFWPATDIFFGKGKWEFVVYANFNIRYVIRTNWPHCSSSPNVFKVSWINYKQEISGSMRTNGIIV